MKANVSNKQIEIGFTFLGKSRQKTQINTEAKLLMLGYAFEVMKFNWVELITDYLNTAPRNVILGSVRKGYRVALSILVMMLGYVLEAEKLRST